MKKFILAVLFVAFSTNTALALPWYWDLTGTGYSATGSTVSGDIVNFPIDVTTSGGSTVIQTLVGGADDTILDDGDKFYDYGFVTVLGTNTQAFPPIEKAITFDYSGTDATAYIYFEGLEGFVFNHNDGGTPTTGAATIGDDSFSLAFTPFAGSIKFYLDIDTDPLNGNAEQLLLADLELLSGVGTSPIPILNHPEGQFEIIAGFMSALDDFWYLGDGTEFNDWMDAYGIPTIFASSFNLGATLYGLPLDVNDGIQLNVINEGSFELTAVPEPSTFLLLGAGLLGLGFTIRRKK